MIGANWKDIAWANWGNTHSRMLHIHRKRSQMSIKYLDLQIELLHKSITTTCLTFGSRGGGEGGSTLPFLTLVHGMGSHKILCISCERIPSFIEQYPISLTFLCTLKVGMKQGLESQTGAQRQGDYVDKFDVSSKVLWASLTQFEHPSLQWDDLSRKHK